MDLDTGRVVAVSYLAGEVQADNMLPLADDIDVQPGDIRNPDGSWFRPPPPPPPEPGPSLQDKVALLETENAFMAFELVQTQARLDQAEQEQAALLLELVDKGVL